MQILTVPKDKPLRLAFSPDGRYLAGGGGQAFHLWDLSAGPKPLWSLKKNDLALSFFFSPNGTELRGGSYSEFARHDVQTGRAEHDEPLCQFDPEMFSPDGRFALAIKSDYDRRILQLKCAALGTDGCKELWRKNIKYDTNYDGSGYRALLFSTNGGQLVRVAGRGGRDKHNVTATGIEVFDTTSGKSVAEWKGELPYYAEQGAVGSSGVVALINGRALHVIDTSDSESEPVKRVNPSPKPLEMVAFSPDGSGLVAVGRDTAATVWDATTWEVRKRYEWQIGKLLSVCFAPDGLRCAAGGDTGQVVVWDLD